MTRHQVQHIAALEKFIVIKYAYLVLNLKCFFSQASCSYRHQKEKNNIKLQYFVLKYIEEQGIVRRLQTGNTRVVFNDIILE